MRPPRRGSFVSLLGVALLAAGGAVATVMFMAQKPPNRGRNRCEQPALRARSRLATRSRYPRRLPGRVSRDREVPLAQNTTRPLPDAERLPPPSPLPDTGADANRGDGR